MDNEKEIRKAELIITPVARRYLTGFESTDGYLLLVDDKKIFYIDGRYHEEACRQCPDIDVRLLKNARTQLADGFKEFGIDSVSVETEITVEQLEQLKEYFPDVEFIPNQKLCDSIRDMRAVKTFDEIENIKKAQRCAERAFQNILNFIRVGVSEKEIAAELDYYMRKAGAERSSFDTIAVSGARGSLPHGVPSYKTVKPFEFITMDFGAVVNGYCSDMTRTVAVGGVTEEMEIVYNTVLEAQQKAIETAAPGVEMSKVDAAARNVIKNAGYGEYFTHSTGHGVGLEIHEAPTVSTRSTGVLKVGNIITDEPGIYVPGKHGVRIEDMLLITENGCEDLTKCDKSLIIL